MKIITHSEFIKLIESFKGAVAVGVNALTDTGAYKTGNPFPDGIIMKRATSSAVTGIDWRVAINRRLEKEGKEPSYTPAPIWGGAGQYIIPNKIVQHKVKGGRYLAYQATNKQWDCFPSKPQYFTTEGEEIPYEKAKPFLKEKVASAKQERASLVGKSQQNIRMFNLDNIIAVAMKGEVYTLVKDEVV